MEEKSFLALDIGTKRTGVAISTGSISMPHGTLEAGDHKEWLRKVMEVVEDRQPAEIIVGLPLNQYGEEGQDAKKIRTYIAKLRSATSIPVVEWDERFTTVQAERFLLEGDVSRSKRKQVIDKVAASILLQTYLDSRAWNANPEE